MARHYGVLEGDSTKAHLRETMHLMKHCDTLKGGVSFAVWELDVAGIHEEVFLPKVVALRVQAHVAQVAEKPCLYQIVLLPRVGRVRILFERIVYVGRRRWLSILMTSSCRCAIMDDRSDHEERQRRREQCVVLPKGAIV